MIRSHFGFCQETGACVLFEPGSARFLGLRPLSTKRSVTVFQRRHNRPPLRGDLDAKNTCCFVLSYFIRYAARFSRERVILSRVGPWLLSVISLRVDRYSYSKPAKR